MSETKTSVRNGGELLSKIEIRSEREGGLIEAMVPVDLIDQSEVAVDENHVRELAESMDVEATRGIISGQLTPILLGQVPGKDTLSIIDGFHRAAALQLQGKTEIFATIRPNTTEDEIDDLRILTANSHATVAFSRIVDWVSSAWEKSPWADRISAGQAFSLAANKQTVRSGARIGLTHEEAEEIRVWTLDKCERWRMAPGTIQQNLLTAQIASPELVARARSRASGHELKEITPDHLKVIAKAYPGNNEKQIAIAQLAIDYNLTVKDTDYAITALADATTHTDLVASIQSTDWMTVLQKTPGTARKRAPKATPGTATSARANEAAVYSIEGKSAYTKFLTAQLQIAKLSLENTVLRGSYLVMPMGEAFTAPFTVNPDHPDIRALVRPLAQPNMVDDFMAHFEDIEATILQQVLKQEIPEEAAIHIVRATGSRIVREMREGVLRHVQVNRPSIQNDLIRRCLAHEIKTYQDAQQGVVRVQGHDTSHVTFDYEEVLPVVPRLQERMLQALSLYGFLGMSAHPTSQILGTSRQEASDIGGTLKQRLSAISKLAA